jgi:hypothetical protein
MTLVNFRIAFPAFATASDNLVDATLAMAAARLSASVLGSVYDEAHGCLTAHLLATDPGGQSARMVNKDGTTTYSKRLNDIKMACVPGVSCS